MNRYSLLLLLTLTGCSEKPYKTPECVKSHNEVVPAHIVAYTAGKYLGHVDVILYTTPEATVSRCDEWR
jgi:hypothetical protein